MKQNIQKRRRGRASRRLAKESAPYYRKRQKEALVAVATYNVGTLAVEGKHGYGHNSRFSYLRNAFPIRMKSENIGF